MIVHLHGNLSSMEFALAANLITSSAKVRHMANKTTAFEPIHCNPRRGQPSQV